MNGKGIKGKEKRGKRKGTSGREKTDKRVMKNVWEIKEGERKEREVVEGKKRTIG